ncbi:MAG: hypothetical protein HOG99_18205, partial [Gemmatimonadetes bacterium]|nr:hypothetical protein [Gemmatimonadota bacterium]
MKLIVFSKMLSDKSVEELADLAQELGIDGYDLAVRPGHPVNPDNVTTADTLLAAMADAGAPRVKLGYYKIDLNSSYWNQVEATRRHLEGWGEL